MNIYFLSDLDETLVTSQPLPDNVPCTSYGRGLSGRETVITHENVDLLQRIQMNAIFIPCTARSIPMTKVLKNLGLGFSTFLCEQGAILYRAGKLDRQWYRRSLELFDRSLICEAERKLQQEGYAIKPDCHFCVAVMHATPEDVPAVQKLVDDSLTVDWCPPCITVHHPRMTKGYAVHRLRDVFPGYYVTADDELRNMDFLKVSDFSYGPIGSGATVEVDKSGQEFTKYLLNDMYDRLLHGGFQCR